MHPFKSLIIRADRYAAQSTWKDFALVKLCLGALGLLLGLTIPTRRKNLVGGLAGLVFLSTCVVLLQRFLPFLFQRDTD